MWISAEILPNVWEKDNKRTEKQMNKIEPIEIMMPVKVLCDGCKGCELLDITERKSEMYAEDEMVGTLNELRCTYVYDCVRKANMIRKVMEKK